MAKKARASISETVSDNQESADESTLDNSEAVSKKRGRPKKLGDECEQFMSGLWRDVKTKRGIQNKCYEGLATSALIVGKDIPAEFAWLHDNKAGTVKMTIMAELGRLEDADDIRAVATKLCELKPRVKDAVAMIRRYRGKQQPGTVEGLTHAISKCIDDYNARCGCSYDQIKTALNNAMKAVRLMENEATDSPV